MKVFVDRTRERHSVSGFFWDRDRCYHITKGKWWANTKGILPILPTNTAF